MLRPAVVIVAAEFPSWVGNGAASALGAVLVVAGAIKLAAGERWLVQADGLGVEAPVARAVPWAELVVGAATATQVVEPWSAVAALVLLAAFTAFLVVRLRAGVRAPCACFGSLSARPMSWRDVARNAVLMGLALVAIAV